MKYKINGRTVTKKEFEAHAKRREALYGNLLEDMLQSRTAPIMANSDRSFMEGANAQSATHGLDSLFGEKYIERARRAGINTTGKVYMSQLGPPTNPLAWVSGIEDLRTSLKLSGKGCESLGIKPDVREPSPDIPLAEDLVQEEVQSRFEKNPDLKAKCKENPEKFQELKAEIVQKHGSRK